jgi:hypothetical protein
MPQLNQVIGAVLRDIAQARFTSDLYSRQISFVYEQDSLLRRFPVPRAEIQQVEFDLKFAIKEVKVDAERHESYRAAVGRLFDVYSMTMMRAAVDHVRTKLREEMGDKPSQPQKDAAALFEKRFLSDDSRDRFQGRLLVFLNENAAGLLSTGKFDTGKVQEVIQNELDHVKQSPDLQIIKDAFPDAAWDKVIDDAKGPMTEELNKLAADVDKIKGKYPDYSIEVEIGPDALAKVPESIISSIRVTSIMKNYKWSKVDVDTKDLRNIRTLNPE